MVSTIALSEANLNSLKQPSIANLTGIQSHGVLLVLTEPDLTILQVSTNSNSSLGIAATELLHQPLSTIIDEFQISQWQNSLSTDHLEQISPTKIWVRKFGDDYSVFDAIWHRSADGFLVLELEPSLSAESIPFLSFYHLAKTSIDRLLSSGNWRDFGHIIVQEVRNVTEFDRVMLYKFDTDGHGEVLAEAKADEMESYLGLHFPESDIPQPARKMFLANSIRVIPDARSAPVDLIPAKNPLTRQPTDLTKSVLRSPYSCHLEYLENMGVAASLTISLIKDGELWGIIACHHRTPKLVPYELRKACEFLGQVIFSEISNQEEAADFNYQTKINQVLSASIERMANSLSFVEGLVNGETNLLDLVAAKGAAICYGGQWTIVGQTPTEEELNYLVTWLSKNVTTDLFLTEQLPLVYTDAQSFKDVASGLLAIPLSRQSYVLWFRPEVLQTVNWGGDPHHPFEITPSKSIEGELQLCPRKSFSLWQETVRLHALPWKEVEIEAAKELRKAIVNIVLRQAEELAILAQDLARSNAELKKFAYVASHDLQEPLHQVANYVQLLEMRYDQQLDADAHEFIGFAVQGVNLMQTLIDDVLIYSKVDLLGAEWELIPLEKAFDRAINNLRTKINETGAIITCDPLPTLVADGTQIMQLFQNTIANAIKFGRPGVVPQIHLGVERQEDEWLFSIRDNGIGIEQKFFDRIFVIFQRLHNRDEYPGSGMGLTICKKVVECHRGRMWVDSTPGEGTTFYFTIPISGGLRERVHGNNIDNYSTGRR
jgi:two-component system, chemotaxis family, sensor kinase Cph1